MIELNRYEECFGPVNSIEKYNAFLAEAGRMSGRTTALINSIPEDGHCAIVSHNLAFGRHIIGRIKAERPDVQTKNIKLVSAHNVCMDRLTDIDALRGWRGPVFVENCVVDVSTKEILERINSFFNPFSPEKKALLASIAALEEEIGRQKKRLEALG